MRMWPVVDRGSDLTAAVKCFVRDVLKFETKTLLKIPIENVKTVGNQLHSKITQEVVITFVSIEDRDLIYAQASRARFF